MDSLAGASRCGGTHQHTSGGPTTTATTKWPTNHRWSYVTPAAVPDTARYADFTCRTRPGCSNINTYHFHTCTAAQSSRIARYVYCSSVGTNDEQPCHWQSSTAQWYSMLCRWIRSTRSTEPHSQTCWTGDIHANFQEQRPRVIHIKARLDNRSSVIMAELKQQVLRLLLQ
jgi:hypothetical protein